MQQVTTNSNHSIQIPGSKEIASMRVVQSCGCGSPKLYVRYKGEAQYVPLKICAAPSSPGLNNRYVDVFSDQAVNGVKSFADHIRVSSSYIKGGATQIFGNTAGGGLFNVLIGTGAGNAMTGQKNIMIGDNAGVAARAINNTIAIGVQSGPATNYLGDNNFFLGYKAGYNMTGGSGNVHIGQGSGIPGTYSNRLFIGNPGEPTTLESAHIITGYFDTGVLRFPKGYANNDASKFLTTGSDGTLVLSAPKMPTDYVSNNPVNTLPRDNTSNHGITDANLVQQSLTYWNNSTKTNTPAGFDQGIGITGISPDGTQAGQVVLDKTANTLSFRGKATNVWKAWRTVETTDNKVTNLDSPNNATYPTTLLLNGVKNTIRTSWSSTNINNNAPPQYCKIMSISFTANVFNSFEGVFEVTGFHGSNAGQDFAGQIYIFCGGGTTNNNTISAFFKKNPFSKNSFSFYYVYDNDNYIFDIYIGIRNQYIRAKFSETEKPSLSVNNVTCTYLDNNGLVSSLPTGAVEFSNYDMASKFDAVVLDWNANNNTSANYTGDLNSINSISYFGFNQNALNRPGFFPYGGTLLNMSLNASTSTQLALGWTGGTGGDYFGYRTKNNGVFSDWYQVASRDWVTSQIPATSTLQQVTAAGNTSNNSIIINGGTGGSTNTLTSLNLDFYPGTNTSWARGLRLLNSSSSLLGGIGFYGNTGNQIPTFGYISSNGSPWGGADLKFIGGKVGINLAGTTIPQHNLEVNGDALLTSLAGTGTRMIITDAAGLLGSQAMPVLVETDPIYTGQEPSIVRYRGNINSGDDLNTYYAPGIWACNAATTPTILNLPSGAPAGSPVLLQVSGTSSSSGGYTTQVLTTQVSGAAGSGYRWVRNSDNSGTWAPWKKVITDGSNVSLLNNDAGYITSAAIPAPQALSLNNFSLSISSGNTITLPFTPYLITAQTNLNGISATNTALSISSAATNSPVPGVAGFGFSSWGGATGVQLALMNNNGAYVRTNPSLTSYTAWVKLATLNDIPIVNDATLTLQTSGIATGGTVAFTANSATAKTFTVNVPGTDLGSSLSGTNLTLTSSTGSNTTVDMSSVNTNLGNTDLAAPPSVSRIYSLGTSGSLKFQNSALNTVLSLDDSTKTTILLGSTLILGNDQSSKYGTFNFGNNTAGRIYTWQDSNGTVAFLSDLSTYVPASRTITAGNGLTGGGDLTANRTITLGTPGAVTLSSTNSVTATGHTHAFAPGGTTSQYIRGDGSLATFPSIPAGTVTSIGMTIAGTAIDVTPTTVTSSGTFALSFAGTANQYINGQGNLTTFPTIGNGALSFYSGATLISSFTANQTANTTIDLANVFSDRYTQQRLPGNGSSLPYTVMSNTGTSQRTTMEDPQDVYGGISVHFKNVSALPGATGSTYASLLHINTYTDSSGISNAGQLAFTTTGVWHRPASSATAWNGNFKRLAYTTDILSYTAGSGLTLTGTAFSLPVTVSGSGNYVSNVAQNANGITVTKATLPTIGNGTLTIQQNGSTVGTFTANQSANTTINLTGGSNEVVDNGYGYGRSNNFGSGWDAAGGFAANSIYITTNTPYQVSENDYTVYLFAPGASIVLPDPANYRNRMIRLVNATKVQIEAPQQYAIIDYDGTSLTNMGVGSYLIQSIRGAGGAWLWYLVGGNS
ncbi:MAG TPA: pyocin knob domain-containing protein [Edaphocola sp.]|nr:pyocin knob domain-containing protein [Edaphocola sp.]